MTNKNNYSIDAVENGYIFEIRTPNPNNEYGSDRLCYIYSTLQEVINKINEEDKK